MIHRITLKKKWTNPDSGKEFKKGSTIALHSSKVMELVKDGYGESETIEFEIEQFKDKE